jgi:nicotinamide-nucleotide amidase
VRVELVLVGDELLADLGGAQPAYISDMLRQMQADALPAGASVGRLTVVGDDAGELAGALREATARSVPAVLVFGGLGPTHDDRTRDEAAAVIGQGPPVVHPEAMAWMLEGFGSRGAPPPAPGSPQDRMAMCPPGARPLRNVTGMAAGLRFRLGGTTEVFCLPGVTIEALPMWRAHVLPALRAATAAGDGEGGRAKATVVVRGLREGDVAPVVERVVGPRRDVRAGVYLTELEGERFRAVRVVLRGDAGPVGEVARELSAALASVPGAAVDPPEGLAGDPGTGAADGGPRTADRGGRPS